MFQRGDQTVLTYDRANPSRTELTLPVTVVEDSHERTMVYLAAGTPTRTLVPSTGDPLPRNIPYRERASIERVPGTSVWCRTNVLICWKPDWDWDVRFMWDAESWSFQCWYVNIQSRVRRTDNGFNSTDHFLDVVIAPNREWTLKDELELDDAVSLGMYSNVQRQHFYSSAHRAIQMFETGQWPFNLGPEAFRPDSNWPLPML